MIATALQIAGGNMKMIISVSAALLLISVYAGVCRAIDIRMDEACKYVGQKVTVSGKIEGPVITTAARCSLISCMRANAA